MKKMMVAAVCLLSSVMLPAQGVYQLWGMTPQGGDDQGGVIFNTDAVGDNFQLRHQFTSGIFNANSKGLLIEYNGKFYGISTTGGNSGAGVIFEWDAATNTYTKKFNFDKGNGISPSGFTLLGGKFYGTTARGGSYDQGVIFEWDPATNFYIKKFDFDGFDVFRPGGLAFLNGKFYGAAGGGGAEPDGALFEWDPVTNVVSKRVTFPGEASELTLWNGKIYGIFSRGGYRVRDLNIFEWDPATNIFILKKQMSLPFALTLVGDKFYGLEYALDDYGYATGPGAIFEWDPATNVYTKKKEFNETDGYSPVSLTQAFGKITGITKFGGSNNLGVIFEYDPLTDIYTKKVDFDISNGTYYGALVLSNGKLYGLFFVWDLATNTYAYNRPSFLSGINGYYPTGTLAVNSGQYYGLTRLGGTNNLGIIFQYDPACNLYTKRFDLGDATGHEFRGKLIFNDGKFYGLMSYGGANNLGAIFEWDPINNVYTKRIDFDGTNGSHPGGSLALFSGKFYGVTVRGGSKDLGVIFEWDPATNEYTKKFDFDVDIINNTNTGSYPYSALSLSNGKFYGMTNGGTGSIFEWDPTTNVYTKKVDLSVIGGSRPYGSLTLYGNKFYGMTEQGGIDHRGIIFEWDPSTNVATKKIELIEADGSEPQGSLTLSEGKFYGMTRSGGTRSSIDGQYGGVIFEWDPVTNVYTKKKDFLMADGATPSYGHDLTVGPTPVAKGLSGSCVSLPAVTIDNNNNNKWVAITDEQGNAVAEIKANGNNLGIVNANMFINNSAVREDGNGTLYLDRNITLSPQSQPTSTVDIRLYIKSSEFVALKNAVNSNGHTSGIDNIAGLLIYKDGSDCSSAVSSLANGITVTAGTWEADYVLSASITSFSSFYFAGKSSEVCAPPVIQHVSAFPPILWPPNHKMKIVTVNYKAMSECGPVTSSLSVASDEPVTGTGYWDLAPDWEILDGHHVKLRAERAGRGNGRRYTITVTSKDASGTISTQKTKVIVPNLFSLFFLKGSVIANRNGGYIDDNGEYFDQVLDCKVTPNPTTRNFNLQVRSVSNEKVEVRLLDMSGRLIKQFNMVKGRTLSFGDDLRGGVFMAEIIQGGQRKIIKIIKQ